MIEELGKFFPCFYMSESTTKPIFTIIYYFFIIRFKHLFFMKNSLFCFLLLFLTIPTFAQFNVTLQSQFSYNEDTNDIWGYAAPDGKEYALVGLRNGVSIVDVTDPANPIEKAYVPGASTTWRDLKTWETYAYVTNEQSGGLLVINLENIDAGLTTDDWYYWAPTLPGGELATCHNIFIDEFGYAYLAGCRNTDAERINNGGMLYIDLFTDPWLPSFVNFGPPTYSHDVYVRDNIMYSSEVYEGWFSIYNVSDKINTQLLGTQETTAGVTHNAWPSDDSNYLYTTDETSNAPVGSYDVSDPTDIQLLDDFRPLTTLGDGVIPHNVHVYQDWLIISYYTDGCIIVDGSNPSNLIEVGNFDTYFPATADFFGAWGAYPFLPSGNILVSDIGNGLFVLAPNYVNACWLEGNVTDVVTGAPLNNVLVEIDATQLNTENSDFDGDYKTGIATSGSYQVTYSLDGYIPQTVTVVLVNGEIIIQDIQLQPAVPVNVSGQVISSQTGAPIPNADVVIQNLGISVYTTADVNGNFTLPDILSGVYNIYAGSWGYKNAGIDQTLTISDVNGIIIELETGYADDFLFDFGWSVSGDADAGIWELGEPEGTSTGGFGGGGEIANTEFDIDSDIGDRCFVTGNGGGNAGNDDVDDGTTTLTSPVMDLSTYNEPIVKYYTWFFNGGGQNGDPNDEFVIRINNGITEVTIETISISNSIWNVPSEINLVDFISITSNMTIIFETADQPNTGHIVEAAVDGFEVIEGNLTGGGGYPDFASSITAGCTPLEIQFEDQSDSTVTWLWTFDGGMPATSTEANPTIIYDVEGSYNVTLEATTNTGNTYTVEQMSAVTVVASPEASFTTQTSLLLATFTNTSTNANGTNYFWDFGDGNISSDTNPTHTYSENGTYEVTLTITSNCGSTTYTELVTVNDGTYPDFAASTTNGCTPLVVEFDDMSDSTLTWLWTFEGGTPATSTEQNPTVTYPTAGSYDVTLEVTTNTGHSYTVMQEDFVDVALSPFPTFEIEVNDMIAIFTNNSSNATSYLWDFGDGNISSDVNPTHLYEEDGEYIVQLTAFNDCGSVTSGGYVGINVVNTTNIDEEKLFLHAFPNPFNDQVSIQYELKNTSSALLQVFDVLGQLVYTKAIADKGTIEFGERLNEGVYFIQIESEGKLSKAIRLVKTTN